MLLVFVSSIALNVGAALFSETDGALMLHLSAVALAAYLLVECLVYVSRSDGFGLLSPTFLASFLHFFFCVTVPLFFVS